MYSGVLAVSIRRYVYTVLLLAHAVPLRQIPYGKMVQLNYEHSGAPIAQDIKLPYETPP